MKFLNKSRYAKDKIDFLILLLIFFLIYFLDVKTITIKIKNMIKIKSFSC